jgi:thioredoxin 1
MMKNVNENEFRDIIENKKIVVDFYATWCGPCKMLSSVLKKIDEKKLIEIVKVDVDTCGNLASEYKIYSVPTLILFENGKEIKRISGFISENELEKWVI